MSWDVTLPSDHLGTLAAALSKAASSESPALPVKESTAATAWVTSCASAGSLVFGAANLGRNIPPNALDGIPASVLRALHFVLQCVQHAKGSA